MDILIRMLMAVLKDRKHKKQRRVLSTVLAAVVVFMTTYSLILPAITLEESTAETTDGIFLESADVSEADPADDDVDPSGELLLTDDAREESAPASDGWEDGLIEDADWEENGELADIPDEPALTDTGDETEEAAETETGNVYAETEEATEDTTESEESVGEGETESELEEQYPEVELSDSTQYTQVKVYAPEGAFPEGTQMLLSDVEDDETIAAICDAALAENSLVQKVHAVDISFRNSRNEEIEPLLPIRVEMTAEKCAEVGSSSVSSSVVHVDDSGNATIVENAQKVEAEAEDEKDADKLEDVETIAFEAKEFSVYALVYTVDFEYSVNGKMYQFSLPGGGFVSFTDLVEVLGIIGDTNSEENGSESGAVIAENAEENAANIEVKKNGVNSDTNSLLTLRDVEVSEATKKFVADVVSVEFSSPELVWVGKVDSATTVGGLKEANGLEVEYSADLTEEQIAEINAQTVEAGDWALISVQPFDTEESLTVTMKNGDQFVVRVTDAQITKRILTADGKTYEITVTYGDDAQIPEGSELKVDEITKDDERFDDYYEKSQQKLNGDETKSESETEASAADIIESTVDEDREDVQIPEKDDEHSEEEYTRIFDIQIWKGDEEIEPKAEVRVDIKLLDAPEDEGMSPKVVHFAKDGPEVMAVSLIETEGEENSFSFMTDEFSVYSVTYSVDYEFEVNGKSYSFSMQGADSVSLRSLVEALHVYDLMDGQGDADSLTYEDLDSEEEGQNSKLDAFMKAVDDVTFSDTALLVPLKVKENTTVGKLKTENKLYPTYPLGLKQSEVLALNDKEYFAGDWALISMKAFDTEEALTVTMKNGDAFTIMVTDAQDAVMNGDVVQTISNPAGTTIDLFDYWVVSQDLVGRDGWGDLNQSQGAKEAGDDKPLNGTGNNKGINSSTSDSEHGHALKFSPAWSGTVYNGNKIGTTGNAWQSVNLDMRDGLNSYTGDEETWHWNCPNPFTGIVQNNLYNGYPILTNNQTIGSNGESLSYLFDPNIAHAGKASYDGVNQLLYVDKDGYYTYDSRDYAASFNTGDKTFTLTEQTSSNSEIRGFWPFGTQNFWTGMHVNTQFSMPTGGQVLNPSGVLKPMQFEFSGDDDVWIYVDGILIGDAGGIHNRTEVDINYQTGIVSISGVSDKYIDDLFRAGLRDQGKTEAEIEEYITQNFDGHTFKAGSYHTFDFFYLERGGGESNLYIHYNLVSTADFTGHKSYFGADENDILRRDQFQFELIGLDGKYRSVKNEQTGQYELVQEDTTSDAIMPHASGSGEGTVASPHYEDNVSTTISSGTVNSQVYITGVTEDGNINFGSASISEMDMHDADEGNPPVYKYIIREIVPEDAVNADGITWADATDDQKAAGGFVKDQVTYDGTVYYMTGRVTSWTETNASGQEVVRHGIFKTYYTDDTYTTVKSDVNFVNFENRFTPDYGNVDFRKVNGEGENLQGATFALYTDEACTIPAKNLDAEGQPNWTATSDVNGKVSFEQVRVGTYYMKETAAPSEYALDSTIYKVVIENSRDQTKKSRITILGDEAETPVTEIANAKSGKITVMKKWLNASGSEIGGETGSSVTVWLKRKHLVAEEATGGSHTVTVTMKVEDGGEHTGNPVTSTVSSDTVIITWDDEWQGNFNWYLTVGDKSYDGWISQNNEDASGDGYVIHQLGEYRCLTVSGLSGNENISFTIKHWQTWLHSDPDHWSNLNNPVITGSSAEPNYVAQEDTAFNNAKHTQTLNSANSWAHTWSIGGKESSHAGFDFPAMDDNDKNYLYYVVELDASGNEIEVGGTPLEGYILRGYSANNNTGISNQGVITIYNQKEGSATIDVVIKKTDNAANSTNYLAGAVFKLEYRADESGTFTNVSNAVVLELDSESKFTVPAAGLKLTGLTDGQYRIQEVSPPAGYVITNQYPVIFKVENGRIANTQGTLTDVRYSAAGSSTDAVFIVPNPPGAALPNTGGPGTLLYTLSGLALICGAALMFIFRMRRRERRLN